MHVANASNAWCSPRICIHYSAKTNVRFKVIDGLYVQHHALSAGDKGSGICAAVAAQANVAMYQSDGWMNQRQRFGECCIVLLHD